MIIEFFGLPGSGKTVNMKELLRHFGDDARQMLPDRMVLKSGGFRLICTAEFLSFAASVIGLWLRKKHKVRYDFRTMYHFFLLYLSYMKSRSEHGVRFYVLDHGLVQSVSSLVWDEPKLYEKSSAIFRHIGRYFRGEIRFVFTDYADDSVLVRRIKTRAYDVRLKHFSTDEAKRVLQTQRHLFAQTARDLSKDFSVLPLDSGRPVQENAERLCRELDSRG